ncbi:MAG: tRNA (adenosine(37)-N6)-threonylcarbamoyltransferase complex transferase subunit TsaD [Candidatus Paraimprobicoccus trichonymphae]|uniref:tRNA N6-adenosine threonylcarbamoyltransferase n=1 Tax=Candidatus Paraimprobicoccus trichonymphae TaxID=3033793 RepID=A0AA48KXM9_9FIRM|nr:MAG: tRNA (adenosine(37)-N6)-threonylcarbamoyltransferase complex transferase subunit TsaD [Candidatus Paraimprobicoccus trichonymphae]
MRTSNLNILAFETSCDDTAVAIVKNGREVLSSSVFSQIKTHIEYGGVVPEIAARSHLNNIFQVTKQTFESSNLKLEDINLVAVTCEPGLLSSLLVGINFAEGFALSRDLELIPVNHLKGHVASLYISNKNLEPPFLCLIVSGGHTQIVEVKNYVNIKILGQTRDDAAGEIFDKVTRKLGLDYPGGTHIDEIADNGIDNFYKFPRPKLQKYDFSFSGIKTHTLNLINNLKSELIIENLLASFRKSVVDYLIFNLTKAAQDLNYRKIAISGGVSANKLLRETLELECKKRNWEYFKPELKYSGDNAAMIGSQAYYEYLNKIKKVK